MLDQSMRVPGQILVLGLSVACLMQCQSTWTLWYLPTMYSLQCRLELELFQVLGLSVACSMQCRSAWTLWYLPTMYSLQCQWYQLARTL
jgi:hypothetical protein